MLALGVVYLPVVSPTPRSAWLSAPVRWTLFDSKNPGYCTLPLVSFIAPALKEPRSSLAPFSRSSSLIPRFFWRLPLSKFPEGTPLCSTDLRLQKRGSNAPTREFHAPPSPLPGRRDLSSFSLLPHRRRCFWGSSSPLLSSPPLSPQPPRDPTEQFLPRDSRSS